MDLDAMFSKVSEELLRFDDRIQELVKDMSDEDMVVLANRCEEFSRPTANRNFPIEIYLHVAEKIRTELGIRVAFRRAEEHMKKTGSQFYCLHCDGDCTPKHLAEMGYVNNKSN